MAAEVLRDTGTPGHAARTERGADGAQRCGARLRCERLVAVVVVRVQVQGAGASLYSLARLGGELFGRTGYRGMLAIAVERCLQQAVILRQGRLLLRRRLHADGSAGTLPNEVLFTLLPRRGLLGSPYARSRIAEVLWAQDRPCDPTAVGEHQRQQKGPAR